MLLPVCDVPYPLRIPLRIGMERSAGRLHSFTCQVEAFACEQRPRRLRLPCPWKRRGPHHASWPACRHTAGAAAARFLVDVEDDDPQQLMARLTGNYKHGNERLARTTPALRVVVESTAIVGRRVTVARSVCGTPKRTSYNLCYVESMADTITFRPDEDAARALAVLTRDGTPVSSAVRAALIDAAREQARSTLRAEAEALAADEQDRAEAAQVLRDMESLRAW